MHASNYMNANERRVLCPEGAARLRYITGTCNCISGHWKQRKESCHATGIMNAKVRELLTTVYQLTSASSGGASGLLAAKIKQYSTVPVLCCGVRQTRQTPFSFSQNCDKRIFVFAHPVHVSRSHFFSNYVVETCQCQYLILTPML